MLRFQLVKILNEKGDYQDATIFVDLILNSSVINDLIPIKITSLFYLSILSIHNNYGSRFSSLSFLNFLRNSDKTGFIESIVKNTEFFTKLFIKSYNESPDISIFNYISKIMVKYCVVHDSSFDYLETVNWKIEK